MHVDCDLNFIVKVEDFSWSQAVTILEKW